MEGWSQQNWKIVAGIAFFLLAMRSLEGTLAEMSGRKFKLFLKRETGSRIKAAMTSTLIAAVLQSSSLVNLLIMDMLGAGILTLENAFSLNLGANLGTTINSWLVAVLGFKVNMESWILPLIGFTGIAMGMSRTSSRFHLVSRFLFSLCLLLFSLDFIKSGMGTLLTASSLHVLKSPVAFLIFGIVVTALVQASSIVMVFALACLYTGNIGFEAACAIVLGGEIGTTIKLFVAASGIDVKKRMALGNLSFNAIAAGIVFIFLRPVSAWLLSVTGGKNQLIALVVFQTSFNILCLLLFLPWLKGITGILSGMFTAAQSQGKYLGRNKTNNAAANLDNIEKETRNFIGHVVTYITCSFREAQTDTNSKKKKASTKSITQQYQDIKQLYGIIHRFSLHFRKSIHNAEMDARLEQLLSSTRNAMYAAKSIHNIADDVKQFRNSSNEIKYGFYTEATHRVPAFCNELMALINKWQRQPGRYSNELEEIFRALSNDYRTSLGSLYADTTTNNVNDVEITTLLNCNREIYSSFKSLFYAVVELILPPGDTDNFDKQPGFIR